MNLKKLLSSFKYNEPTLEDHLNQIYDQIKKLQEKVKRLEEILGRAGLFKLTFLAIADGLSPLDYGSPVVPNMRKELTQLMEYLGVEAKVKPATEAQTVIVKKTKKV